MSTKKSVGILCPVFREAQGIRRFHDALSRTLLPLRSRYDFQILYVMDPSDDETETILGELSQAETGVTTLVLSRRFGHQAALAAGIARFTGDALIMMDADLQHPPSLLPEMLRHYEEGAEIVQTIRTGPSSSGRLKDWTSALFYGAMGRIADVKLHPGAADFRLLSGRVIEVLKEKIKERNPFLRGLVSWMGYRLVYLPYPCGSRVAGKSKFGTLRLLNLALNGLFSFSKTPLRLAFVLGTILSAISILVGIVQILIYFTQSVAVPGWASLFAAVSLIGGIHLLFLGVIGEYVGQIFDEVKGRPTFLVAKVYEKTNG